MRGRIIRLVLAAVGLYFVWPAIVDVFGSFDELSQIQPRWFIAMAALEVCSFICMWLLIGISTSSRHWTLIALSQLVGNAVSSVIPAGGTVGGPMQYSYMVRGGEEPERTVSGLAASGLLSTTALFGLSALCVPALLRMNDVDPRLERAAWLGLGVFVVLLLVGIGAFTFDRGLRAVANAIEWAVNLVRRRKPKTHGLPDRVIAQRDRLLSVLGSRWPFAVIAVVAKWAFDYFALVAAVGATGARVNPVLVLVAYVAASVLAMVPITPGGLGFVEAGLAATLVWAGVPSGNATVAVLAYRMVSYWLPLAAGLVAAVVYRARYGPVSTMAAPAAGAH